MNWQHAAAWIWGRAGEEGNSGVWVTHSLPCTRSHVIHPRTPGLARPCLPVSSCWPDLFTAKVYIYCHRHTLHTDGPAQVPHVGGGRSSGSHQPLIPTLWTVDKCVSSLAFSHSSLIGHSWFWGEKGELSPEARAQPGADMSRTCG